MKRKLGGAVVLFAALSPTATFVYAQAVPDKDQIVRESVAGERDCVKEDWKLASEAQASGLLDSEELPTRTCRAVSLRWLPSAQIVQTTGVEHRDVFVSMTFVRLDKLSPIRLVRVLGGLVDRKELEDAASHRAVFNELLRRSAYEPNDNQFLDLAILYLFMVGHPPDESPKRLEARMKVNDLLGWVEKKNGQTVVRVHQRTSRYGNSSREWRVEFRSTGNGVELVEVAPEH